MQKEFKTRHDWVEKVIHRELCKKFKFDHTNKWYMHNPESVPENEMHKLLWDSEILSNLSQTTRPCDSQKKKTCRIVNFAVLADNRVKLKESVKRDNYLDHARELKTMKHEGDGHTSCNWRARYNHQRIGTGTGVLGNRRTRGEHPKLEHCPNRPE